jgi:chorismate synthase
MAVEIRPFASHADYAACVALQRETWGADFVDVVPPSVLKVAQRVGGVASGAFEGDRLLGFVFGLTGVMDGQLVHWSDMLAVRRDARRAGLALRLKEHQRDLLLAAGVHRMRWTFDPLVARNAHFNFVCLGVRLVEYVVDMYGHTGSSLHGSLPTDRLVVEWDLDRVPSAAPRTAPIVGEIEVPPGVEALLAGDRDAALRWRLDVRDGFRDSLARGDGVAGFELDRTTGGGRYLFVRTAQ